MTLPLRPGTLPGTVRQIGYVVAHLDQAIDAWLGLGVGPWYVVRDLPQRGAYRGERCEVTLSIAFANSGDLQIELIQQSDDTPSIYTEVVRCRPNGSHHLAWWADDFNSALSSAVDARWPVVWSGDDEGASVRFAYLAPSSGEATIVEIMELTDVSNGMAQLVRAAAQDWDGSDPVRSLPGS